MRQGGLAMVLVAGLAAAWLAAGPGLAEDAAGQVVVAPPAPVLAYTPADPNMIAVADQGNERVQVFWPNGTFAFKFKSEGPVDGGFRHLLDVAVGPDGRIFVIDYRDGVRVFNPTGSFSSGLGSFGTALGQFYNPHLVAVGPDGRIVVIDAGGVNQGGGRIQVLTPDGEFERVVGGGGYRVAVGPDGKIVAMTDNGIEVYHPNGSLAARFDWRDSYYEGSDGRGLAVGPDGRIFVDMAAYYDGYTRDEFVRVFHPYALPNGSLAYSPAPPNGTLPNGTITFGPPVVLDEGLPPSRDRDVAVGQDGRIVVSSADNHSVQVFHPNGSFALTFGSYGALHDGFDSPTDVAAGPDGQIVVAEPGRRSIQVFHPNGSLADEFGSLGDADGKFYTPARVAVGPDGQIVVGDTGKKRIQVFRPDPNNGSAYAFDGVAFGSHGYGERQFVALHDVAVGPDGRIAVADDLSVKAFHPNGSFATSISYADTGVRGVHSVAVGPDGRFVVGVTLDDGASAIVVDVFDPNGAGLLRIGAQLGAFHVAVAPNGMIVAGGGGVVQAFHPNGALLFDRQVDIDVAGIAVGPDGRIVAVDTGRNLVHVFNRDGSFAFSLLPSLRDGAFNRPVAVAVGPMSIPASAGPPLH